MARVFSSRWRRKLLRFLIMALVVIAILPPLYFHFTLQEIHLRKCSWIKNPPLVCAHGGDSTRAFPNTIDAYRIALSSQVDCIEVDVSRSSDGVLFALHDRSLFISKVQRELNKSSSAERFISYLSQATIILGDCISFFHHQTFKGGRELQQISGNNTSKVGYLSMKEIRGLVSNHQQSLKFHDVNILTLEDALKLISGSVRLVILDAKVGPPLHEKELAKDILSVVERTKCKNCIVWAKSDSLVRDIIRLSMNIKVGYIVMMDLFTGTRTNLLRMRNAEVVGVYHHLIDEKVVGILHGRNKKVYGWTVDDEESMKKMLLEHVDAIVTSNPSLLHRVMQDTKTRCFEQGFSLSS